MHFLKKVEEKIFILFILTLFFQTSKHFIIEQSFVRGVTIDYLIPAIYFSDICIGALFLVWSVRRIKTGFTEIHSTKILLPACLFFLFFLFSFFSLVRIWPFFPGFFKLVKCIELFFLCIYVSLEITTARQRQLIFTLLFIGIGFESVIALFEWFKKGSLGLQFLGEWKFSLGTPGIAKILIDGNYYLRPQATTPHPNVLGGLFALLVPVIMSIFLKAKKEGKNNFLGRYRGLRILVWAIFFMSVVTLFLTFSRVAWIVFALETLLVFVYWLTVEKNDTTYVIRHFLTKWRLAIGIVVIIVVINFVGPGFFTRFDIAGLKEEASFTERMELNSTALAMIRSHPYFGVGYNNFIPSLKEVVTRNGQILLQPAHNLFLLITAEIGVAGFLAFFCFWGSCVVSTIAITKKNISAKKEWIFFLSSHYLIIFLGMAFISFFDHYFWTIQQGLLLFFLMIGLSMGLNTQSSS